MPVSLPCFRRSFIISFVLAVIAVGILTFLGFWQVHRAQEKKELLNQFADRSQQAPMLWEGQPLELYQPVQVSGHYLSSVFFLDNQVQNHQFGFNVVSPFRLSDGRVLLIDRGWVVGDPLRKVFPQIETPKYLLTVTGRVYYPSKKNWVLGQPYEIIDKNKLVIERLDTKLVGQVLHKSVYPFIIRLNSTEPNGYSREWPIVSMPPTRHYAYALQWFVMAVIAAGIYIVFVVRKFRTR